MRRLRAAAVAALVLGMVGVAPVATAPQAEAHGWVASPPSRQDHCATGTAPFDCGPIQYEPQSVEAPKGSLQCSGGNSQFAVLDDEARPWPVTSTGSSVEFRWRLTAPHNTSTWEYFVDGRLHATYDQGGAQPPTDISHTLTDLPAGKHTVLARWNVSNTTNAFYSCVDIEVDGTGTGQPDPGPVDPGPGQPAPGTCEAAAWSSSLVYTAGDRVNHHGRHWEAKWWTLGEVPGAGGEWGVWRDLGPCTVGEDPGDPTDPGDPADPTDPDPTDPTDPGDPGQPGAGSDRVVGYFTNWGTYGRDYLVKDIVTSGAADQLTHIMYAFGNVQNGRCTVGDSYADYERTYTAAESVDGVADAWDDPLRGAFNQLRKLKQQHPDIKVVWSFGGWTWSGGFGQAAQDPAAFARSCRDLVEDPRWADVFDGIDIDWEYPNACGDTCDTSGRTAYRDLLAALRAEFGDDLVTSAITADPTPGGKIDAADYAGAAQYVDFYMPMTYDFFGAWARTGPTAPHSPLRTYDGIPTQGFDTASAIAKLKDLGIPSDKLLLGIGFYGRGWTGVTQATPGGSATGPAPGTYEAGIEDYKVLVNRCPATGTVGGTAYGFCNGEWWSYDTPATITAKTAWAEEQDLGGAFFWELSGDTPSGDLVRAVGAGVR